MSYMGWGWGGGSTVEVAAAGNTDKPVAAQPRDQLVASADPGEFGFARLDSYRGGCGWHSLEIYERMMDTPAVKASFDSLRAGVLQSPIEMAPAATADPSLADDDPLAIEAATAELACASLRRTLHLCETPLDLVLYEMCEAMAYGHMLAEIVYDDVRGGPDDGLWYIRRIRVLDRRSYRLVVDSRRNWVGVRAQVVTPDGKNEWRYLDKRKFWLMTWDAYRGDPRGRSVLRAAVHAWQMLIELWPDILGGWKQFGRPNVVGILGKDAKNIIPVDREGHEIPGRKPIQALWDFACRLLKLVGGSSLAIPFGSDVKVIESSKGAAEVAGAVRILDEQITKSVLFTTRGTMEAEHGSKADSQTSKDVTATGQRIARRWVNRCVRGLFMRVIELNYGEELAPRITPLVDLGSTAEENFAANVEAAAKLGYKIAPSQTPDLDVRLNLRRRTPAEVEAESRRYLGSSPGGTVAESQPPIEAIETGQEPLR